MGAGDRNTKLRKHQLADASVDVTDLETTNSASDKQIPSYDSDSGKFKWVDALIALWTGYTEKTTPVDNDIFLINDSASSNVLKKTLWTDIKATLKTYFDGLYKATFAYTAEDVANKSTNVTTDGASDTKYPSVKAVKTYVDNSVIGLLDYRGGYNASGNTYPTTGGSGTEGAILKGDLWIISIAGTLGGVAVQVGDAIVALVDTPGQTSSNWNSLNGNIAYVPEDVANKSTDGTLADNSIIKYPSQSAVKTYADGKLSKSIAGEINALTNKAIPVDADVIVGEDSANSWSKIKIILSNLKSYLKTYFDTLYIAITAPSNGDIIYYNNGTWQRLSIGTIGQTLKINWDAFTKAMLHCDGAQGSTSFIDEIGKSITNIDALTKLLCHMDGTQGGVAFTDSETTPKTITNTANYDQYNKLMMHCDGSQGATSFTDSESGNKTITNTANYDSYTKLMLHGSASPFIDSIGKTVTNNNVTLDSVNKILGQNSMLFNGTTAYLSLATHADWNIGSGDFTIEMDIIATDFVGTPMIIARSGATPNKGWYWYIATSGELKFGGSTTGTNDVSYVSGGTLTTGVKYHICVERLGNTLYFFIDGVPTATTGDVTGITFYENGQAVNVGSVGNGAGEFFKGNLGEVKISKGIARYPITGFTPPTAPFGQVYCDTSVKKFGTGSARFLGSGEYLSLADSGDWNFGTGDFTVDLWFNLSVLPASGAEVSFACQCGGGDQEVMFNVGKDPSSGNIYYVTGYYYHNGGGWQVAYQGWSPSNPTTGNWYHVAFVRNGSAWHIYQNGVACSDKYTINLSGSMPDISAAFEIGRGNLWGGATNYFNGYIDELRISKGIARWTSDFIVPTNPYGQALTSTSIKEFGTASGWFDGEGSYLSMANSADWGIGSGDFTIDAWVYFNQLDGYQTILGSWGQTSDSYMSKCAYIFAYDNSTHSVDGLAFMFSTDGTKNTVSLLHRSWTPTINTLYHLAVVRSGTNVYFFVNGTQLGATYTGITQTIYTPTNGMYIGTYNPADTQIMSLNGGASNFLSGYIDELRFSKGIARWTTGFTPPTSAYNFGVYCDTTKKEFGTASAFFDGGSYISLADSADWNFGSGQFTVDGWYSFNDVSNSQILWSRYANPSSLTWFMFYTVGGCTLRFNCSVLQFGCPFTPTVNTLYHIAVVRVSNTNGDSTNFRIYVNGVSQSLTLYGGTWNLTIPDVVGSLYIGTYDGTSNFFNGNIDELRISKGIARWTSNFTPPTSAYIPLPIWST